LPYIITRIWYPSHKQNEIIKKYLEISSKYSSDENVLEQLCAPVNTSDKGIEVMGIYDVKEGKLEQALSYLGKYLFEFINIEGCEYSIRTWYTFEEAAGVAGFKIPE